MGRFDHIAGDAAAPKADGGPAYDFAHYLDQARSAHGRGAWQSALRLYGRALEEDRNRPEAWLGQVRVLLDMGQAGEAATWMEQAGKIIGEVPELLSLRAIAAVRRGELDEARQWSDRAMRDGADSVEVWLARATVVYGSGNGTVATVNLDKAHERAPGALTARRCGEVALEMGDLDVARRWLARAERDDPDNALVCLRLGVLHARRDDEGRAREYFERALVAEPRLEAARLALEDLDARGPWSRVTATMRKWMGR